MDEVKKRAIELFFPKGSSKKFGSSSNYIIKLGDFSAEAIEDLTKSIGEYLREVKMSGRIRLYLLTEKKSVSMILNELGNDNSDDDFDETPLPKKTKKVEAKKEDYATWLYEDDQEDVPKLIGTSMEREELKGEIDAAYEESLRADQKSQKLSERMMVHRSRVQEEPSLIDAHVTLTVRHTTLGLKVRIFREDASFREVYVWVASLATEPEWFHLQEYSGNVIVPTREVFSSCLNMLSEFKSECNTEVLRVLENSEIPIHDEQEEPLVISDGDEVDEVELAEIPATDSRKIYPLRNKKDTYSELQELREHACQKLVGEKHVEVCREDIYNEMLTIFTTTTNSHLSVCFTGEDAVGDGVTKDAFAAFFNSMYEKWDGDFFRVPPLSFDEDEMEKIGNIIYHAYIQCEIYPFRIAKSAMLHYLNNDVDDASLLEDFLQFLPSKEAIFVREFMRGASDDVQAVTDILLDYQVYERPSAKNIRSLLIKAARTCLIRVPAAPLQQLVKPLLSLFTGKIDRLDSLYEQMTPSSSKVIDCLRVEERTQHEQHITTWLHRLLRTMEQEELTQFLRFTCGSPTFDPNMVIKVEYLNQQIDYLRPRSLTCFKILKLARQYKSFYQLRDNILLYLKDGETWKLHDGVEE